MTGERIDPNEDYNRIGLVNEAIRGETSKNIKEGVGGSWGDGLAFVYQIGTSIVDAAATVATFGGGAASLALMGTKSAQSTTMDALKRGASNQQALTAGLWAGVAEVAFEKFSLEHFIKLAKGGGAGTFIGNTLKQMGIEGSEELSTEIANQLSDYLVMGGLSNYHLAIEEYTKQGKSPDEAKKLALLDMAKQVGLSALGGALSGGVFGAVGGALGKHQKTAEGKLLGGAESFNPREHGDVAGASMPNMLQTPQTVQAPQGGQGAGTSADDKLLQAAQEVAARGVQGVQGVQGMQATAQGAQGVQATAQGVQGVQATAQGVQGMQATAQGVQGAQGRTDVHKGLRDSSRAVQGEETEQGNPLPSRLAGETARVGIGGRTEEVTVAGVRAVENGAVYLDTVDAEGTKGVVISNDVTFDNDEVNELLATGTTEKMNQQGADSFLTSYDSNVASVGDYARAFRGVYASAKAGIDYQSATGMSQSAQTFLTSDARMAAYAAGAGENAQGGEIVYSLKETRGMPWNVQVGKVDDDSISSSATLNLGRSGKIYEAFGMDDIDIGMNIGDMRKVTREQKGSRSAHELSKETMSALPQEIQNPVAIYENTAQNCVYVLTALKDKNGAPVVAVISKNETDGRNVPMHQVKSAYGMNSVERYMNEHLSETDKRIVYNKKMFDTIVSGVDYTMNQAERDSVKHLDDSIHNNDSKSNKQNDKNNVTNRTAQSGEQQKGNSRSAQRTPGLLKDYSQAAFDKLGNNRAKRQALFEFAILDALAKQMHARIRVQDEITVNVRDASGKMVKQSANGMYDPKTGVITLSLAASDNAYSYVAMHELTHMLRAEHPEQWHAFYNFVTDVMYGQMNKDVDALYDAQRAKGLDNDEANEEIVCNAVPAVLQSEANLKKLLEIDKGLFARIKDFIGEFVKRIKMIGSKLGQKEQWEAVGKLSQNTEALEEIYDRMMGIMAEKGHYDYSRSFAQQVDDWVDGKIPRSDTLLIGRTPKVFRDIGLSDVPMTMDQVHMDYMVNNTKNEDHHLGAEMLKQLPRLLEKPIAIIESATRARDSVVAIVSGKVNGKQVTAAINVGGNGYQNQNKIDSNHVVSVQGRKNTVTKLLAEAIQKENAGQVGVYYWDKEEAIALHGVAGVQFPGKSVNVNLIHSIREKNSPVNRKFLHQTDTVQFKQWVGDSQVKNKGGAPKKLYRQTKNDSVGELSSISENPTGILLGTQNTGRGRDGREPMPYFARIENPLRVKNRAELTEYYRENIDGYALATAKGDAQMLIDMHLKKSGYDGVCIKGEQGETWIAFEKGQVKSATENVGLFDLYNTDVRYSLIETSEELQAQQITLKEAFSLTHGHHITALDAQKIAEQIRATKGRLGTEETRSGSNKRRQSQTRHRRTA